MDDHDLLQLIDCGSNACLGSVCLSDGDRFAFQVPPPNEAHSSGSSETEVDQLHGDGKDFVQIVFHESCRDSRTTQGEMISSDLESTGSFNPENQKVPRKLDNFLDTGYVLSGDRLYLKMARDSSAAKESQWIGCDFKSKQIFVPIESMPSGSCKWVYRSCNKIFASSEPFRFSYNHFDSQLMQLDTGVNTNQPSLTKTQHGLLFRFGQGLCNHQLATKILAETRTSAHF